MRISNNSSKQQTSIDDFRTSAVLNAMHDEIVLVDADGVIVFTNRAWRTFCAENGGSSNDGYLGSNYLQICRSAEGNSSSEAKLIPDGFSKALQTGETFHCEYPCDSPTVKRWFELTANLIVHNNERLLIVQHRNITTRHVERDEIEQAFINSSAMIALVTTMSDAILSYDLSGKIITWNRAAQELYGYTEQEALGQTLDFLYPDDWSTPLSHYRDEILAGRLQQFEATRVAKDGTQHDVWISGAPIRSADGDVVAVSNIHRDVTEIRKAERARDLIAHEVIHRAKNMLSVVSAIQRQTARAEATYDGFKKSFEGRIQSLSQSTDLLVNSVWTSVLLTTLIDRHLDPFVDPNDKRYRLVGPEIGLKPECVQMIGMAIHELATNSAKYGALRNQGGQINIEWSAVPSENGPSLHLRWHEVGISTASQMPRKGFGSTVLTSLAPSMIGGKTEYKIEDNEISWTIAVPSEQIVLSVDYA